MKTDSTPDLGQYRKRLDEIDNSLLQLLGERFQITKKVGEYKKEHGLTASDPNREQQQFEKITALSEELGINPDISSKIFRTIIDEVVRNHKSIRG